MKTCSFIAIFIFVELFASVVCATEAVPLAADEAIEKRLVVISEELRCLVCQNESLAASRAELAMDLRAQIREQIQAGQSDQDIRNYLVERYGDFVLYRPPVKPITWALWIGPFLSLGIGIFALYWYLRRRQTDVSVEAVAQRLSPLEEKDFEKIISGIEIEDSSK